MFIQVNYPNNMLFVRLYVFRLFDCLLWYTNPGSARETKAKNYCLVGFLSMFLFSFTMILWMFEKFYTFISGVLMWNNLHFYIVSWSFQEMFPNFQNTFFRPKEAELDPNCDCGIPAPSGRVITRLNVSPLLGISRKNFRGV